MKLTDLSGRFSRAAAALLLLTTLTSCEIIGPDEPELATSAVLTSSSLIQRVTVPEIQSFGLPVNVAYEVDLIQLIYETPSPSGELTIASGLLAVPVGRSSAAPLVSYQHGTEVKKDEVASVGGLAIGETLVAVVFAAAGYVTVMPDYLGLGVSPGLHPYVHASSLATSTVDMMRAGREYVSGTDTRLSGDVFLVGYSEGGNATVAAQRLIEADYAEEFELLASAPMAGAYDMSGIMVEVMQARTPYPAPYYLPYILLAFDDVYDIYESPEEVFVSPYETLLPGLFDGTVGAGAINNQLPEAPITMMSPVYEDAFNASENHPLRVALRDNDLYDWSPQTPTRLYHCVEDDLIPFANSQRAFDGFVARGAADVSLAPLEFGGHVDCVAPALILAKFWFDEILGEDGSENAAARQLAQSNGNAGQWMRNGGSRND